MCLIEMLEMLLGENKDKKKRKDDFFNKKKDDGFDDFEECCENCGELLEDCECDDKKTSMEDISMFDIMGEDDD